LILRVEAVFKAEVIEEKGSIIHFTEESEKVV
jgi:hypothetical protein